jgi:hypothetical protein
MKNTLSLSVLAIALMTAGCGGGSGGSSDTTQNTTNIHKGVFLDSAVEGLSYTCELSKTEGTTDNQGTYECKDGDSHVTFSIGSRYIGTSTIEKIITPSSLFDDNNKEQKAIDLARLLQTMDNDGDPSNGIKLDDNIVTKWENDTSVEFGTQDFENTASTVLGKSLVDETTALEHINNTLSKYGIPTIGNGQQNKPDSISASELEGKTIVAEYKSNSNSVKIKNIEKVSYIFLYGDKVIAVFDLSDGSRKVAHGSYNAISGSQLGVLDPIFDNGENFMPAFGIASPTGLSKITVGQSVAIYPVTAIIDNDANGIDEATVTSTSSSSGDTNSGDIPMYDILNGKSMTILNNATSADINGMDSAMTINGFTRKNSNTELHCSDYGYPNPLAETDEDNVHVTTYMEGTSMCVEYDYKDGSNNAVWYK